MYEEDVHRFLTPQSTEGDSESNIEWFGEVPYCFHWKTVRQISDGGEHSSLLGDKPQTVKDTVGFPSILPNPESTQRIDECDWWEWISG